jgi:hypothetical protein
MLKPEPVKGSCYFLPKQVISNINYEIFRLRMTDKSLFVTARHAAKFALAADSNDSQMWSPPRDPPMEASHDAIAITSPGAGARSSSHTPGNMLARTIFLEESSSPLTAHPGNRSAGVGQNQLSVPRGSSSSSSSSSSSVVESAGAKPYKTPKAVVTTLTNISAKDKSVVQFANEPVHVEAAPWRARARSDPWHPPPASSDILDSVGLPKEVVLSSLHTLTHDYQWSLLNSSVGLVEHQTYVVPLGRPPKAAGIENIEFFTERRHLVTHVQRNPVIVNDFKESWTKLSEQGWCREPPSSSSSSSSSSELQYRIHFPAATTVLSQFMTTNTDQSEITNQPGLHGFHSQAAMHLYLMRFPYPLQEDAVLTDTLLTMGWTRHADLPATFCHPRLQCERTGATLDQVRHLLWTDPTLLFAEAFLHSDAGELSGSLRTAFKVPDDRNIMDPAETEQDSELDDSYVRQIVDIVQSHVGTKTEHILEDGGVWWEFSTAEVKKLEALLVKCGWRIVKDGLPDVIDWWKHFRAYLPDFEELSPSGSPKTHRKGRKAPYLPGVSIFWSLGDAVRYITTYGNVLPIDVDNMDINLRVNYAAQASADFQSIVSSETFCLSTDFRALFQSLLDVGWSMFEIKSTKLKEFYPSQSAVEEDDEAVDCVFAASWAKDFSPDGLLDTSSLVLDQDFFVSKECVVNYLKVIRKSIMRLFSMYTSLFHFLFIQLICFIISCLFSFLGMRELLHQNSIRQPIKGRS